MNKLLLYKAYIPYFYISSDSFVLFWGIILHNPRINCLQSWVRLCLFGGKSGANEQLIKMQGDYVLICKGVKSLIPPCIVIHNPLAFQLAVHKEKLRKNSQMFIGNIKHDAIITKIKLSSVSFAPHSRIFLVVGSSPDFHSQNDSPKLNSVFNILWFHESVAVRVRCSVL